MRPRKWSPTRAFIFLGLTATASQGAAAGLGPLGLPEAGVEPGPASLCALCCVAAAQQPALSALSRATKTAATLAAPRGTILRLLLQLLQMLTAPACRAARERERYICSSDHPEKKAISRV